MILKQLLKNAGIGKEQVIKQQIWRDTASIVQPTALWDVMPCS
jgi:hypothetical protein